MTPTPKQIGDLKVRLKDVLTVYQRALSESNLALQQYLDSGTDADAEAWATKDQMEAQLHHEYRTLVQRLRNEQGLFLSVLPAMSEPEQSK